MEAGTHCGAHMGFHSVTLGNDGEMVTLIGNTRLIRPSNNLFHLLNPVVLFLPRIKKNNSLNTEP